MQYILTEEEYNHLLHRGDEVKAKLENILLNLCTRVAEAEPVHLEQPDGHTTNMPWGCILVSGTVCDHCPVIGVCPNEHKEFSK